MRYQCLCPLLKAHEMSEQMCEGKNASQIQMRRIHIGAV